MRLTQKIVDGLQAPDGKASWTAWDDDTRGLGLRFQGQSRRWVVRYRPKGTTAQRQINLGDAGSMALAKARLEADEYVGAARKHRDLAAEHADAAAAKRRDRAAAEQAAKADRERKLSVIVSSYLKAAEKRLRPGTLREVKRYLERHWEPLHSHVADTLTRQEIVGRLAQIDGENGPTAANRAKAYLSACLAWAVGRGLLDANPVVGIKSLNGERKRDRVLSEPELRAIWSSLQADEFGDVVRLLILTGQRREEVAGMAWAEVDLAKGEWLLPAERSKNHKPHVVPLSQQVIAIMAARHERAGKRVHVFGKRDTGFSGFGKLKAALDAQTALPAWVLHDLRRTAVTLMAEMGISPHVVEAVVNHISGAKAGVAGVYNRATYAAEKRLALQAWADKVDAIVSNHEAAGNVVRIKA